MIWCVFLSKSGVPVDVFLLRGGGGLTARSGFREARIVDGKLSKKVQFEVRMKTDSDTELDLLTKKLRIGQCFEVDVAVQRLDTLCPETGHSCE